MKKRLFWSATLALAAAAGLSMPSAALSSPQAAGPEDAKALYRQGNGLFDQNRFAEAVAAYSRALEADPKLAEAYHNRALANEMVDRQKAMEDWRRFIELGTDHPALKWDVARAQARLEILKGMPQYPEGLQPAHYVPEAGDYYWQVARNSEQEKWTTFPIKAFLGSPPDVKWLVGAKEAFDIWKGLFPLQLTSEAEDANIRLTWEASAEGGGRAGEEMDWVQFRREGGELSGRRVAIITVDLSRRWSKDEMRAILLHEMGHALGIKAHSDSRKDIMFWMMQEKAYQIPVPVMPFPVFWKSLVSKPSQRDLNTLIRLYNSAGPVVRFQ